MSIVGALARRVFQISSSPCELRIADRRRPSNPRRAGQDVACGAGPPPSSVADHEGHAARGLELVHVARRRWDRRARAAARRADSSSKSCQSMQDAGRAGDRRQVDRVVGRAAGREQADHGVDDRLLVDARGRAAARRAVAPSSASRWTAARVSACRSGVPGIDEGRAGHVQAHQLHHHLVASWRCRRRCRCRRA